MQWCEKQKQANFTLRTWSFSHARANVRIRDKKEKNDFYRRFSQTKYSSLIERLPSHSSWFHHQFISTWVYQVLQVFSHIFHNKVQ